MFGLYEILAIIAVIALVALFGRKTLKNLIRTTLGAKKDFEEVKKEFKTKN